MISLDRSLFELVRKGWVSLEDGVSKVQNPEFVRSGGRTVM